MRTFNVIVTRDTTESATVTVEARNEHEAQARALERAHDADWKQDYNLPQPAYVTDVSEEPTDLAVRHEREQRALTDD